MATIWQFLRRPGSSSPQSSRSAARTFYIMAAMKLRTMTSAIDLIISLSPPFWQEFYNRFDSTVILTESPKDFLHFVYDAIIDCDR